MKYGLHSVTSFETNCTSNSSVEFSYKFIYKKL